MLLNTSQGLNQITHQKRAMRRDHLGQVLKSSDSGQCMTIVAQAVCLMGELWTALRVQFFL